MPLGDDDHALAQAVALAPVDGDGLFEVAGVLRQDVGGEELLVGIGLLDLEQLLELLELHLALAQARDVVLELLVFGAQLVVLAADVADVLYVGQPGGERVGGVAQAVLDGRGDAENAVLEGVEHAGLGEQDERQAEDDDSQRPGAEAGTHRGTSSSGQRRGP